MTVSSSLASKALPTTRWWSLHLALAISCSDVEQPANALIAHFGNLRGILDAPIEELRAARRIGSVTPIALQIIRAAAPSTSSRERGPVTLLRTQTGLPASGGCVSARCRPRSSRWATWTPGTDLCGTALHRAAVGLVLAHNHPNGVVSPNDHDKALTRAIVLPAETVRVRVLDHLIVSAYESSSFRKAGLL